MRILHVIENLNTGGAEHMLVNLVIEQVRRGHQVQVMCLFEAGDLADRMTSIGVPVLACHKALGFNLAFVRRILAILNQFKPEAIHAHSLMGNYYIAFFRLWAARSAIQVVTRHGLLREGNVKRLNFLFHQSLWMTHWAVGVCDAVSDELLKMHVRFTKRICSIKNGINLERFIPRNVQSQRQLQAELQLDAKVRLVGIVARLNPIKNHALLLDAFALVLQKLPQTALIIVGDGAVRQSLEAQAHSLNISTAVFFLGDRDDIPAILAALDVFVLSSDNEGYSLALLEAAAAALPMVVTDVGGNRDIVKDHLNGLVVPPQQAPALADALVKLLSDLTLLDRMGQQAKTDVEQFGSVQAMADAYDRLYTSKP